MIHTRRSRLITKLAAAGVLCIAAAACSKPPTESAVDTSDYLVRIGNDRLTHEDLRSAVPPGLSATDSARYVKVYIKEWIDSRLVDRYARTDLDMTEIDRLTDEYRRRLITLEYRRRLFDAHRDTISPDSIAAYYEAHRSEFVLQSPLIRGVYLKVPATAANLSTIRRLYRSNRPADIDRLDKESTSTAIHYDYFRNNWIDWRQVETRIPANFGDNPDAWPSRGRTLDSRVGNFVYLLYISDMLPAGSIKPLEAAREEITTRLLNRHRADFDREVERSLYTRAIKSGELDVRVSLD